MQNKNTKIVLAAILLYFFFPALTHSAGYDFFVDKNSTQMTEDGSEQYPWKTIGAAMENIRNNHLEKKNIFIRNGTYSETVKLVGDTNLYGEDRHQTIINAETKDYGIYFRDTESLVNGLTIEKGQVNLEIGKYSKVTIDNCSLKDAASNGILVNASKSKQKYKFTFRQSSVKDSGKRGMYIFKRKIEIADSEISGNDEEGIDLHTGSKGEISGNTIENNEESGIEMMIAGADLTIKSNRINGNHAQGASIQFYDSKKGTVRLQKNTIRDNHGYGLRYARYDHGKIKTKFYNFVKKHVKLSKNSISGNGDGKYSYLFHII